MAKTPSVLLTVRMTKAERVAIRYVAKLLGYRSAADYVRAACLATAQHIQERAK